MAASDDEIEEQLLGGKDSIGRKRAWWKLLGGGARNIRETQGKYAEYDKALRSKGEIVWDSATTALGYLSYVAYLIPGLQIINPINTCFGTIKSVKDFRKLAQRIKEDKAPPLLLAQKLRSLVVVLEKFQRDTYGEREGNPEINDLIKSIDCYADLLQPPPENQDIFAET